MFKPIFLKLSLYLLCLMMSISVNAASEIQRVEPLNWWVGMKLDSPQLLIYGENISSFTPRLKYKGVKIKNITRVDNPNYLFVTLEINKRASAGNLQLEFVKGDEITRRQDTGLHLKMPSTLLLPTVLLTVIPVMTITLICLKKRTRFIKADAMVAILRV